LAESLAGVLLEDHDALVREYAAFALAKIGTVIGETPRRALASAAEHDKGSSVRRAAADALKQISEASSS
jgi:HEAT repeat protein